MGKSRELSAELKATIVSIALDGSSLRKFRKMVSMQHFDTRCINISMKVQWKIIPG